jgi:hypothetical protein
MSDALLAGLKRFDLPGEPARSPAPGSWKKNLGAADDVRPQPPLLSPEPETVARPMEVAAPASVDLSKIEASLAALNAKLDKIERDARTQTLQSVTSIAAKLFPELSSAFLADEIGRHLPAMVPPSAAVVEIRAEASLADKLRDLVERTPALAHRCTVTAVEAEGQGRVDVSWQSGGLTFDFDALLRACLAHLNSNQNPTKE